MILQDLTSLTAQFGPLVDQHCGIGSRSDLDAVLHRYTEAVHNLEANGDTYLSDTLAQHVQRLTSNILAEGVVYDEISKRKFMTRKHGGLLGGGTSASKASDIKGRYASLQKACNSKNDSVVLASLDAYCEQRNVNRVSRVLIKNESTYELEYVNYGSSSGYFFSDAIDAFGGRGNRRIEPGHTGGFLHTKKSDSACGSVGYVTFRVRPSGRNYIVCVAFSTSYSGNNSVGVEIRVEDGASDENGNIKPVGHGVDPTGSVTDINQILTKIHGIQNDKEDIFEQECRFFKVDCGFTNVWNGLFRFTVTNVKRPDCYSKYSNIVRDAVDVYSTNRNAKRVCRVLIENKSTSELELINHGSSTGYFFSDAEKAFGGLEKRRIEPEYIGGLVHIENANLSNGSTGYVSFRVRSSGRKYIVCIAFSSPQSGANSAGVEICVEDAASDESENIKPIGQKIDENGLAKDISAILTTSHDNKDGKEHKFNQACRFFKVECSFTNESIGLFQFTVHDVAP